MSGIRLTMHLSYGPRREMTVSYAPGGQTCFSNRFYAIEPKPMIRITNRLLLESGFSVGTKVSVEYGRDIITIRKVHNHEHENLQTPCPLTDPVQGISAAAIAETVRC